MHTNLLVTVKFSPDNRFGFAGVMKGSMEMLAVDVGQIPIWHESALVGGKPVPKIIGRKTKGVVSIDQFGLRSISKAAPLVCTSSHLDPKLRGFAAVTRLRTETEKYLLICGRGIKNVHVWLFAPSSQADVPSKWSCLYDVATNGVTIEALGFRERLLTCPLGSEDGTPTYRLEMVSKSSGMGIRVWDLSRFDEESNLSSNKIPHEDVPMSSDCRAFSETGEMAFGGTYDFSTTRIELPKAPSREIFEVPSPCLEDDNGQRKRRYVVSPPICLCPLILSVLYSTLADTRGRSRRFSPHRTANTLWRSAQMAVCSTIATATSLLLQLTGPMALWWSCSLS
jgi:hypothetical protein